VNRRGASVLGRPVYPTMADLPAEAIPDLVAVAVPAAHFADVVEDALDAGARAIVGITSGLGEKGGETAAVEARVAARVRERGAVLVGPNSMGMGNNSVSLAVGWGSYEAGPVYAVSQSGNLLADIAGQLHDIGLGLSRYVSVGNQADLAIADFVADAAHDEATTAVVAYIEDFRDGRDFVRAAREATRNGKTVAVMSPLPSAASARSAQSHTGALLTDFRSTEAACRSAGVLLARTTTELVGLVQVVANGRRPRGRRVYVFGDGGGNVTIAAGLLASGGLDLPVPSGTLRRRLDDLLPATSTVGNPTDLSGASERDMDVYLHLLDIVAGSGEYDVAVGTGGFGSYSRGADDDEFGRAEISTAGKLGEALAGSRFPVLLQTAAAASPAIDVLRGHGLPVFKDIGRLTDALRAVAPRGGGEGARPPARPTPEDSSSTPRALTYDESRRRLAEAGVRFPSAGVARDADDAVTIAAAFDFPVVVKDLSSLHKSDGGGVVLGIRTSDQLHEVVARMRARGATRFSVEEEVDRSGAYEMLVGARRDRHFGPLVAIGMGGTLTEVLDDVAIVLPPVDDAAVRSAIASLRAARLLGGYRDGPPAHLPSVTRVAGLLADLLDDDPTIDEAEINPLLVDGGGAVALDARIILGPAR
jgi:acyl-CoA synthetase (NDP forming)